MPRQRRIRIIDTTLRDGSHAVAHRFTAAQVRDLAGALQAAQLDTVEVSHGDGLGGSSIQYGLAATSDAEALQAAASALTTTKLAVLLLPGIGVREDLELAHGLGARVARIATHVTEADISAQHIGLARQLGMEVIGFLMLSHMVDAAKVLEQAKQMESYGASTVYVVDSAGAMLPDDVRRKVSLLRGRLRVAVGFHGHNNLGLAVGNTVAAVEEGADVVDGTLGGLGAGAGNAPTEVLAAVFDRLGYQTGVNLYTVMDVAENQVRPIMTYPPVINRASLSLGYAGVYSSFLLHTYRAAERFGVDPRDILLELGRRRVVGGQEDMIVDVALELSRPRAAGGGDRGI